MHYLKAFSQLNYCRLYDAMREGRTFYTIPNERYNECDGLILNAMMRTLKPRRIVEVGCGMSSCMMLDTSALFLDSAVHCTLIDPSLHFVRSQVPAAHLRAHSLREQPVQQVPTSVFSSLCANDILFIDSSHMYGDGSDVFDIFHRILPLLAVGVHIHFHDIFASFSYPESWGDMARGWNEIDVLREFLTLRKGYDICFFTDMLTQTSAQTVTRIVPELQGKYGGSLWLRKTAMAGAQATSDALRLRCMEMGLR